MISTSCLEKPPLKNALRLSHSYRSAGGDTSFGRRKEKPQTQNSGYSLSAGCGLQRGESQLERQQEFRPRHSSGEPGNDRGAKGVAERGSGQ
jgi:hypothetical protein